MKKYNKLLGRREPPILFLNKNFLFKENLIREKTNVCLKTKVINFLSKRGAYEIS